MKSRFSFVLLTFLVVAAVNNLAAQIPHPDAKLPAAKGSWIIEQKYKTIIPGTLSTGAYNYLIIQSDGVVYRRSYFEHLRPIGPWCRDELSPVQMRTVRAAVQGTRSNTWGVVYGNFINIYAPWKMVTLTTRDSAGNVRQSRTRMLRFYNLPADLVTLATVLDTTSNTALTDCNRTLAKMNLAQYRF